MTTALVITEPHQWNPRARCVRCGVAAYAVMTGKAPLRCVDTRCVCGAYHCPERKP